MVDLIIRVLNQSRHTPMYILEVGMDSNICYFAVNVDHSHEIDCFCRGIPLTQSLSSFMQINCVQLHCVNFSTSLATRCCSKFGF